MICHELDVDDDHDDRSLPPTVGHLLPKVIEKWRHLIFAAERERLVAKLGLDPRMAEVLTIEELHEIEASQGVSHEI